jgi:tyrosyl-tRNA synthetase
MTSDAVHRSDLVRTLVARGYLHQCTDLAGLDGAAASEIVPAYVGYDMTAKSLHVGNLISIMMLRVAQQTGHKPIVLVGGATTKIGDPSDKDTQRPLLSEEQIAANKASIQGAFAKFLKFGDGPTDALLVDNSDWLEKLGYVEMLRLYGPHFTINRMLTFDSVRRRLDREQPLTFLEFNYMLMQAIDYLELSRRLGCRLQMGGSDQWGNIVNGVELNRRIDARETFGLTTPLLTTASGAKMGKTAAGAMWLNADMLSPYEYWQFWRNTEDADVPRFLRLYTDMPEDEVARLAALQGAEINAGKVALANAATTLLHGAAAAAEAEGAARAAFEQGGQAEALPTAEVPAATLAAGLRLTQALIAAGLAASGGEAKRLIEQGAIAVNNVAARNAAASLGEADLQDGAIKLTRGKTRHARVKPV